MAADELLLDLVAGSSTTILRLYGWSRPTLSIGRSQAVELATDQDFCRHHGIDIVRRPTGGQVVLHDAELTYAVASSHTDFHSSASPYIAYRRISEALVNGFKGLGLCTSLAPRASRSPTVRTDPCFLQPGYSEIVYNCRKIAGSAQRHFRDRFLQHGSILIGFNADLLAGATRSDASALREHATSIQEALGGVVPEGIDEVFAEAFAKFFEVTLVEQGWKQEETAAIERRRLVRT